MEDVFKKEILFKMLVIGDFGVGKTSIIKRYAEGSFSSKYKITIGADFALKQLEWDGNTRINLQLWDIAGHERFGCLTSVYYRYAVGAAVVFDLTRPETFDSVTKWVVDLREKVSLPHRQELPIILLANKADITINTLPLDLNKFCKEHKLLSWHMTSAKENINIHKAMNMLVTSALDNNQNHDYTPSDSVIIQEEPPGNRARINPCCSR